MNTHEYDAEILHYPDAGIRGPLKVTSCEEGPGFTYWSVHLPGIGPIGMVTAADAQRMAELYQKGATRGEIRTAWLRCQPPAGVAR